MLIVVIFIVGIVLTHEPLNVAANVDSTGAVDFVCDDGFGFKGTLNLAWISTHISGSYSTNFIGMDGADATSYCPIDANTGTFDGSGTFGKCARQSLKDGTDKIVLQYLIQALPTQSSGIISRESGGLQLKFECSHLSDTSVKFAVEPSIKIETTNVVQDEQEGTIDMTMKLLTAGEISNNQKLEFVTTVGTASGSKVASYYESCWVTKEAASTSTPKYELLRDNCIKDTTFKSDAVGLLAQIKMSFISFVWLDETTAQLFVHCVIRSCWEVCPQTCSTRRKRRAVIEGNRVVQSVGPIKINNNHQLAPQLTFLQMLGTCDPVEMGCSQACDVYSPQPRCVCFDGYYLTEDNKTCQEIKHSWNLTTIAWMHAVISWSIVAIVALWVIYKSRS